METIGHALVIFLDFRETVSIATDRPSIHQSDRPHLTSGSCIHSACCNSLNSPQDVSFSKMARVGGLTTMKQWAFSIWTLSAAAMKQRPFLYAQCRQAAFTMILCVGSRQQQLSHDDIARGWRTCLVCGDYGTCTGDISCFSGNSFHSY